MKKLLKVIIYLLIICGLGYAAYYIYQNLGKNTKTRNPYSAIPSDAIYFIETKNLTKGWYTISDSKIWKHLTSNPYFKEVTDNAMYFDSLMNDHKIIGKLLKNRSLIISTHMISAVDWDFIFYVDIETVGKLSFLTDAVSFFDYTVNRRNYNNNEIIELIDNESNEPLYLFFLDNILAGSYNGSLIEKVIDEKDINPWSDNIKFTETEKRIDRPDLFRIYFNYKMLPKYMKCYLSEESEQINALGEILAFSGFDGSFNDELLTLEGYTSYYDSIPSYLSAMQNLSPGRMEAYKILSSNTALYLSLTFSDFMEFFNKMSEQFANSDSSEYDNINKNIERAEKWLKIDLDEVFFSWIGEEIAFVKLKPVSNAREEDVIIAIKANNIENAKEGLDKLMKQIQKRSPAKFDELDYNNFKINYLNMNGFFRMFLGKLFGKLEKPYFTIINDYVVFSNSPSLLMDQIDDYIKGKTLENDENFMSFFNNMDDKSNISIYIQMPKVYQHLIYYSDKDTRESIKENRELILSFAKIAFQMKPDNGLYQTNIYAYHDENSLMYEEFEKLENAADDLFLEEYDTLGFKPQISDSVLALHDGLFRYFFKDSVENSDSVLIYEGMVNNGKLDGLWRTFYKSGNLKSAVVYFEGKADGNAMFYYDNPDNSSKAEVNFDNDVIVDEYKEYYENGNLKAKLEFYEGKLHGKAEFYYDSGKIKIKGQYKKGIKSGKWKYYAESGELLTKDNWKKHFKENKE
ncbi:MAG: DUF3352 domain-containing protein [Marinilabiliales bacterium]